MSIDFSDLFSIKGRVALVTGGSRGIGEMIAAGYLSAGAKVYISSRKAAVCEATAARLSETYHGECIAIPSDLSGMAGVETLAREIASREPKLDILVNNAGAAWGAKLGEFPEVGWDKVMDTNAKGPFFLTQALLPQLRAAASPEAPARVINIGSIDGIRTPSMDNLSYGPAKAAIHYMTRVFVSHLAGEHIRVNAIAPGPFPTWMLSTGVGFGGETEGVDWGAVGARNPSGRVGSPQDAAGLAIFLASKASSYITGQVIALDGGIVVSG
ncbi:MAG: 3-oxoacyl-ACP reductase [Rhodobacteraceae bacterium]|nr:3-oxoacyl-ACP reductase [Paracoccaceae bacterium]MBR28538.1 3-oxoacyl-ACP reductase [Paracoccaceae bacterium]